MPFAGYPDFNSCVSDQSGKVDDPEALCAWLHWKDLGRWPGEMSLDKEVEMTALAAAAGWSMRNGQLVKVYVKTRSVRNVQIFAVGIHNGDEYTHKDLENMVSAYHSLKGRLDPPVKLGHTSDKFNKELAKRMGLDDFPINGEKGKGAIAIGWVENLQKMGDILVADFIGVPDPVADLIESRLLRKVSAEILFNHEDLGTRYPRVLSAVALLGAELPAVSEIDGLEKAAVLTYTLEAQSVEYENNEDLKEMEDDEVKNGVEAITKIVTEKTKGKKGSVILRAIMKEVKAKLDKILGKKEHTQEEVDDMKEVKTALSLAEDTSEPEVVKAVNDLKAKVEDIDKVKLEMKSIYELLGAEDSEQAKAKIEDLKKPVEEKKEFTAEQKKSYEDKISELQAEVNKGKDEKRIYELTDKAKEWTTIAGKPEELAQKIFDIEKVDKDAAEKLIATYSDIDAQAKAKGLNKAIGSSVEPKEEKHEFAMKMDDYKKAHPEKSNADVQAAMRAEHPTLFSDWLKNR